MASRAGPHLALIGLMGAGKTAVGQLVADQLGRPLPDVEGRTPGDLAGPIVELVRASSTTSLPSSDPLTVESTASSSG